MKFPNSVSLIVHPLIASTVSATQHRQRCTATDSCWPEEDVWQEFNQTVSGRLLRSVPSAAVCHEERYNASACAVAKENWANTYWRTNQTGGYTAILWELGPDGQCFINSTKAAPCDQGMVPYYSVAAMSVEDVQESVKFASENDLYLVVKNTGHDHLGRSSGQNAFSIWTHNMKGKDWHRSFVPEDAPSDIEGVPAVTLQAGEQWQDVYNAAAEQGVIVLGGAARTVGAAGGFLTGGGVSPFSRFYGLAVDNLLEVDLVDAYGEVRKINEYTDPDYFYAIRGGAGSSWGVIISVTYKTHPNPSHIQVGAVMYNATEVSAKRSVLKGVLQAFPNVTDAGYTGYAFTGGDTAFAGVFLQPNATNQTFDKAFGQFYEIANLPGVSGQVFRFEVPTWLEYTKQFLSDLGIATNSIHGSRLLNSEVLLEQTDDLVDLMLKYPEYGPGFDHIGIVNPVERDNTAVHSAYKESRAILSFYADWKDEAPADKKRQTKLGLIEISKQLGQIVGPDGGSYVNEANPYEPDWEQVFWGEKYDRLLAIKRRVDPTNLFVCNRCVGTDIILEP